MEIVKRMVLFYSTVYRYYSLWSKCGIKKYVLVTVVLWNVWVLYRTNLNCCIIPYLPEYKITPPPLQQAPVFRKYLYRFCFNFVRNFKRTLLFCKWWIEEILTSYIQINTVYINNRSIYIYFYGTEDETPNNNDSYKLQQKWSHKCRCYIKFVCYIQYHNYTYFNSFIWLLLCVPLLCSKSRLLIHHILALCSLPSQSCRYSWHMCVMSMRKKGEVLSISYHTVSSIILQGPVDVQFACQSSLCSTLSSRYFQNWYLLNLF